MKITAKTIKEHWENVEEGFFDKNKDDIDENGWLNRNIFLNKLKPKGKKLLDCERVNYYRPKSLSRLKPM